MTKRKKAVFCAMSLCLILAVVSAGSMGCKKTDPADEPNGQRKEQDFSKPGNEDKANDSSNDNSVSFDDLTGFGEDGSGDKNGSDSTSEQGQSGQTLENQVSFQAPGGNDGNTSSGSRNPSQPENPGEPENPEDPKQPGNSDEQEKPEDPDPEESGWTRYY